MSAHGLINVITNFSQKYMAFMIHHRPSASDTKRNEEVQPAPITIRESINNIKKF